MTQTKTTRRSSAALPRPHCPRPHCPRCHGCGSPHTSGSLAAGSAGAGGAGAGGAVACCIAPLLHPAKPTRQKPFDFLYNLSRSPPHGAACRPRNIFAHFVRFARIASSSGGGGSRRVYGCNQCLQL